MGNILFIDDKRIYKFRIGDYVKIGNNVFLIKNMSPLIYDEEIGECNAGATIQKAFSNRMKPLDGFIYFVEMMGIDGECHFRFEFPENQPHFFPRNDGNTYIEFWEANKYHMKYIPYVIMHPEYPTVTVYNPSTLPNNSDMYFRGWKWQVGKSIDPMSIPAHKEVIEITDYPRSGLLAGA